MRIGWRGEKYQCRENNYFSSDAGSRESVSHRMIESWWGKYGALTLGLKHHIDISSEILTNSLL